MKMTLKELRELEPCVDSYNRLVYRAAYTPKQKECVAYLSTLPGVE